jgi:hypothetical protein
MYVTPKAPIPLPNNSGFNKTPKIKYVTPTGVICEWHWFW